MDNRKEEVKWYFKPWAVILLLFLVLGPFGLPLLYKSPRFHRTWKVILTILTILYTWYLVVVTIESVREVSRKITQLQGLLG